MAARARSNVDHTGLISKSIFVTNFPDNTTSKDLWEVCKGYGTVVDVFIPDRKSKARKRAKELFVWSPTFNDNKEVDDYSEDDSVNGAEEINGDISKQMNLDDETDIEGVSDTVFDDKADSLGHEHTQNLSPNEKENSSDPFILYNLLNKRDKGEQYSGGSILEVIDDMIKVGQSMGFTMKGCMNDMEKKIIGFTRELTVKTKLDSVFADMDVKVLWGNYKFEYTISEAVGNSGGILCVWDPSVFRKEHHVVSDNFVALYGSWVSNQAKLLVVSIYAPHLSFAMQFAMELNFVP
ncbi:RNA-directed DNA polymerase, eukaryota [Tanacetum coccineum]